MKTTRWADIKAGKMSPTRRAAADVRVRATLVEMDLQEMRKAAGKTQAEVAAAMEAVQAQVSQLENRDDHLVSTLRRYVEALGGELRVIAAFGDHEIRLRAAG